MTLVEGLTRVAPAAGVGAVTTSGATAIMKVQLWSAIGVPVEALRIPPAPPTRSTRITVPFGSGGFGFAVATRPLALRVTVAATRAFVVRLRSRKVAAVTP